MLESIEVLAQYTSMAFDSVISQPQELALLMSWLISL